MYQYESLEERRILEQKMQLEIVQSQKQEGTKHDQGKPDLSLVPFSAQCVEAKVFQFGAGKYGRDNFKAGMESHRLVAAAMRHIGAYWEGEDLDPESGLSHLGHARCCLAMLIELERLGKLKDTRFRPEPK